MSYNVDTLRAEFPGLAGEAHGKPLVYLDSAATTQKHISVIERMDRFLRYEYGTVHRGMYARSVGSTAMYELAREQVARFFNAPSESNIVFTMGCTDAINLVAWSWGRAHLSAGDRILITGMEHHSNIVPWQLVCEFTGAELIHCPLLDDGSLDLAAFDELLDERVKLVSVIHVANSLGTINPVVDLARKAHAVGARILVDGAQSSPHMPIDVQALDCDFFTCSAHKLYGPTGIGALYGKADALQSMPPWRGGGEMIERVTLEKSTYAEPPARFEAGTPPIVEAIGFGQACAWLQEIGMDAIQAHERELFPIAEQILADIPGLHRIGTAPERSTLCSFVMDGGHASDIAAILDMEGVAVRAGHHCAQPVMDRFGIPATARISLGCYTNVADLERAGAALRKAADMLQ
ncbi:MAG: SufS family cysteine desulfurase [Planctomycetota bacterium]|jgi:cysteine desulfurase/selenocysteine lyase|nr:SufS family cysteine desulfurase [Planctomycetota bacterium]